MQIFIKSFEGDIIRVEVTKSDKILELKKRIEEIVGLLSNEQKLVYQARILDDDKTVHFYRISEKSVINVVDRLRNGMQILVNTLDGRTAEVEVTKSDTIMDVKKKVQKRLGLHPDGQTLMFHGFFLENNETVDYYRFVEKCVITVFTREIITVKVKTSVGEVVQLHVTRGDAIIDMKKRIQETTGLNIYDQRLIYRDNILSNGLTVADCQIADNGSIRVESRNGALKYQGICLIICNEHVTKSDPSCRGANEDEKRIRETFEPLGFKIKAHRDVTFNAMEDVIQETKDNVQTVNDMLIVFVLSRGNQCSFLTADGRTFPYQNVWSPFSNDNLTKLAGKPKLFFLVIDQEVSSSTVDSPGESHVVVEPFSPSTVDFFLGFSSCTPWKSTRDADKITFYVDCLCNVVTRNPAWSVSDVHHEVQRRMALKSFRNDGLHRPYCVNHLSDHAYLLRDDY